MKINFTKKEYRLLLDMIAIAGWVLDAHSVGKEELAATAHYEVLRQKIMSYAREMDCEDRIFFDDELQTYFESRDSEMNGEYMSFVKAFEENSFWDELIQRMAARDFLVQTPESIAKTMSNEDVLLNIEELKGPYEDEFSERGIENLMLVNNPASKLH
ncbi:MAG: hypothetical protein B0D91_03780 [Oceanospirillales bacterium LUC14_002_19_P2]|nr:MAG: hypothetical protein B0D91_03780 [Oceanospirillales bacterium LUC14_002_19_P2]